MPKVEQTDIEYATCQNTGMVIVARTGLTPVMILSPVPERGYLLDEVRGVAPEDAAVMVESGVAKVYIPAEHAKEVAKEQAEARAALEKQVREQVTEEVRAEIEADVRKDVEAQIRAQLKKEAKGGKK